MTYLALSEETAAAIAKALLADSPAESGMFALLSSVRRGASVRLAVGTPLWELAEFDQQHEGVIEPSGRMISAAVSAANAAGSGLAFIHTHPSDRRVPALSRLDYATTTRLGEAFAELLDGEFASLVVSPGGWAGAIYRNGDVEALERLTVSGRRLHVFPNYGPRPGSDVLDDRQRRVLGTRGSALLRTARIGIVGVGGTGSPIAETLARMGVGDLLLVDPDKLDRSNLRRVFAVTPEDAEAGIAKVAAVSEGLRRLSLGSAITALQGDVGDAPVQGELLLCDVIIGATDNHASRGHLTELAARALIPLIDVGVRAGLREDGSLDSLYAERRLQIPDGPCLWCWRVLESERIRLELMSDFERYSLRAEGYVAGADLGRPEPAITPLNLTAAAMATSTLLGLISGALDQAPLRAGYEALRAESFAYDDRRDPACICRRWRPV